MPEKTGQKTKRMSNNPAMGAAAPACRSRTHRTEFAVDPAKKSSLPLTPRPCPCTSLKLALNKHAGAGCSGDHCRREAWGERRIKHLSWITDVEGSLSNGLMFMFLPGGHSFLYCFGRCSCIGKCHKRMLLQASLLMHT